MRELTDDEQDAYAEHFYNGEAPPDLAETPEAVLLALIEAYRQAKQDAIHDLWGQDYPEYKDQERLALWDLHAECDEWGKRYAQAMLRAVAG